MKKFREVTSRHAPALGFSLVELLVVITVIGVWGKPDYKPRITPMGADIDGPGRSAGL